MSGSLSQGPSKFSVLPAENNEPDLLPFFLVSQSFLIRVKNFVTLNAASSQTFTSLEVNLSEFSKRNLLSECHLTFQYVGCVF